MVSKSGYEIYINCGEESCNSRVQVEQVDALPLSWVVTRHAETKLVDGGVPQNTPVTKIFCGWRCVSKFAKYHLGASKKDPSAVQGKVPSVTKHSRKKTVLS